MQSLFSALKVIQHSNSICTVCNVNYELLITDKQKIPIVAIVLDKLHKFHLLRYLTTDELEQFSDCKVFVKKSGDLVNQTSK